ARSGGFAPVRNLGLIVVDEEHDASYKQEETPRYNGRDVAIVRAQARDACVVLGSATPSLESRYNASQGKYTLLELPDRVAERPMPEVHIVDAIGEFERSEEHTSELQSRSDLVCRLLLEKKKKLKTKEKLPQD